MKTRTFPTHNLTSNELAMAAAAASIWRNEVAERWEKHRDIEDRLTMDRLHVIIAKLRKLKAAD